ncbi:MAG TPA: ATP-binding protein, partial [Herpetosiphonaceae bacterium]
FARQRPLFVADVPHAYPAFAEVALRFGARALLAAPITAGEQRLGVLAVYAPQAPMFAEDDLALVELLASQAAVILESRALIDEAARVQAREEATRLKDDFLSAAAHDLKTPLTALIGRAQLMERRALRNPEAPADLGSIRMVIAETRRLKHLVLDLLDAARAERGSLITRREEVDLTPLARDVCERYASARHQCVVTAEDALVGCFDPLRIGQLFDNLIGNAVKYSPEGGPVRVELWREDGAARLVVADTGIGIPADDLPHIFERFHRGANVDDRRFSGMGLGLYICHGIVEEHGGSISARPNLPHGTQFHVSLPLVAPGGSND